MTLPLVALATQVQFVGMETNGALNRILTLVVVPPSGEQLRSTNLVVTPNIQVKPDKQTHLYPVVDLTPADWDVYVAGIQQSFRISVMDTNVVMPFDQLLKSGLITYNYTNPIPQGGGGGGPPGQFVKAGTNVLFQTNGTTVTISSLTDTGVVNILIGAGAAGQVNTNQFVSGSSTLTLKDGVTTTNQIVRGNLAADNILLSTVSPDTRISRMQPSPGVIIIDSNNFLKPVIMQAGVITADGNGLTNIPPAGLAQNSATVGNVLVWNGSFWVPGLINYTTNADIIGTNLSVFVQNVTNRVVNADVSHAEVNSMGTTTTNGLRLEMTNLVLLSATTQTNNLNSASNSLVLSIGLAGTNNVLAASNNVANAATNNDNAMGARATNNDLAIGLAGSNNVVNFSNISKTLFQFGSQQLTNISGASGTPSASTFLAGDYTWKVPAGGGGGVSNSIAGTNMSSFVSGTNLVFNADVSHTEVAALGTSLTNGLGNALSNDVLVASNNVSLRSTNYTLATSNLLSAALTNQSLLIGANDTNEVKRVGQLITNSVNNASNSLVASIGLASTNSDLKTGLAITNDINSTSNALVASIGSASTNNDILKSNQLYAAFVSGPFLSTNEPRTVNFNGVVNLNSNANVQTVQASTLVMQDFAANLYKSTNLPVASISASGGINGQIPTITSNGVAWTTFGAATLPSGINEGDMLVYTIGSGSYATTPLGSRRGTATSIDATATNLATIGIPVNSAALLHGDFLASGQTNVGSWTLLSSFRNVAGTISLVKSNMLVNMAVNQSTNWNVRYITSGSSNLLVQAIGDTNEIVNWNWQGWVTYVNNTNMPGGVGGGGSTLFADNFTATDGTDLSNHVTSTGSFPWIGTDPVMVISNNAATNTTDFAQYTRYWVSNTMPSADYTATIDIVDNGDSNGGAVCLGIRDNGVGSGSGTFNAYYIRLDKNTRIVGLYKSVNGGGGGAGRTQLATNAAPAVVTNLWISASGTTISAKCNAIPITGTPLIDTSITAAGYVGIGAGYFNFTGGRGVYYDNLVVTSP